MNKKLISESIFVIVAVIFLSYISYFSIAAFVENTPLLGNQTTPINNSNLSTGDANGFSANFTCNFTTSFPGDTAPAANITNLSLWANFNGSYKLYNLTPINLAFNGSSGFNVTNWTSDSLDGIYKWRCVAGYDNGTVVHGINKTVIIDRTAPITRFLMSNNTWLSNNTNGSTTRNGTALDWTITGNVSDTTWTPNCTLTHDAAGLYVNANNFSFINSTINSSSTFTINKTALNGAVLGQNSSGYKLNLTCVDSVNRTNVASIVIKVDGRYPVGNITIQNSSSNTSDPSAYINWTNSNFSVGVLVSDRAMEGAYNIASSNSSGLSNCSLYGDFNGSWSWNQTMTVSENTRRNFTGLNLATNITGYKYYVSCIDVAGNFKSITDLLGNFNNNTIMVDSGAPGITEFKSSVGNILGLGGETTLTCTATDDYQTSSTAISVSGASVCSGGSTCSGTYRMSTDSSKTATCNVYDRLSNSVSSSLTLSASGGTGGGTPGPGGGPGGGPSEEPTVISTEPTTVTSTSGAGESIPLTIHGENYNLGISSVGIATTSVTIADKTIDLIIGETQEVDVNGDGTNDVEITLDSISDNKPQFTIREIALAAPGEEVGTLEEITKRPSAMKIALIALAIVLAVVIIIYIFERKKR